ncbi:hypothetical protein J2T60_001202 [Natronospira proteinivora]|uniref:Uncharacterized protein n=1 Tax=Natronospira proteinivora TaxID=1807133 RepID=A0ABT1GBE6_9GAMM|nr:hypothetical protein [Natronospira proteinivora]MCP1727237.1 hypothetical protein [Natronospira proteinivora]
MIQTIAAIGRQDVDPDGLVPPTGVRVLAASSDHLVLETECRLAPGTELRFGLGYSALLRVMTSPFVTTDFATETHPPSLLPSHPPRFSPFPVRTTMATHDWKELPYS